jgi:hypothetical protein
VNDTSISAQELIIRLEQRREEILRTLPCELFSEFKNITTTLQTIRSLEWNKLQESQASSKRAAHVVSASSGSSVASPIAGGTTAPSGDSGCATLVGAGAAGAMPNFSWPNGYISSVPSNHPTNASGCAVWFDPRTCLFEPAATVTGGTRTTTPATTTATASRVPLSIHKQKLVSFLLTYGACTRAHILEKTGIPSGSLSELLKGDEFAQVMRGVWIHKKHRDYMKPSAAQKQKIIDYLKRHGQATFAALCNEAGITVESLAALMNEDEFEQTTDEMWKLNTSGAADTQPFAPDIQDDQGRSFDDIGVMKPKK